MSRTLRLGDNRKWIADLIFKPGGRVALHILADQDPPRPSNRLLELTVDGRLGGQDPNWRFLCALQVATQGVVDRLFGESEKTDWPEGSPT